PPGATTGAGFSTYATSNRIGPKGVMYRSPTPGATSKAPFHGRLEFAVMRLASVKSTKALLRSRKSVRTRNSADTSSEPFPPIAAYVVQWLWTPPGTRGCPATPKLGEPPTLGPCPNDAYPRW